jgi:primary-amine oxidase
MRDGATADKGIADLMIHEESTGFAYAGSLGRAEGKMLVLWSMAHFPAPADSVSSDGYTYVIRWSLHNDGMIKAEVGATGGLQHLNVGSDSDRGHWVGNDAKGERVFAPSHVHNFYFRIDFDIDGPEGNIAQEFNYEVNASDPLMADPLWRPLTREQGRLSNEQTFRSWRVVNPTSRNSLGHPRSYQLMPGGQGVWRDGHPYWLLKGDFFLTRYRKQEFPYTQPDPQRTLKALGGYLNNEELTGSDLVVWYRMGLVHHPRSEDWKAQPIIWHGFSLMPRDFLDSSPLKPE